jgi:uncharacterized membrane protein YccC
MGAEQTGRGAHEPRRLLGRLWRAAARRDPEWLTVKRSIRAAVVMPGVFALSYEVVANSQTSLFAAFGAFALLLLVDLPGRPRTRLVSYLALFVVGVVFITVGTLCSTHIVLAVVAMGVVGFAVLFCGIFSPQAATGTVAALLTFVLPVAVAAPPSQIPARLLGWSLAGVFSITACMLVWPRPWHNDLRRRLSAAASALSRLAGAHAAGHRDPDIALAADSALTALRQQFEATPYPPTGATPGASALAKLVGRMEWVGTNAMTADPEAPTLSLARVQTINAAVARTLAASASLICDRQGHPVEDAAIVNAVATERTQLEDLRINSIGAEVVRFIADDDSAEHPAVENEGDMRLLSSIDPAFHARALGLATEMVADATLEASGAWVRNSTEGGGRLAKASDWLYRGRSSLADMLSSHLTLQSVWLRNALRGAIGLALAVAVAESTNVEHGFWVVLGTLSVLRSNALGTGATALRAIAGTVAGFIIGSAILFGLSNHSVLLWAVLPLAVFLAGVAPTMISFATGQAGFTVTVVVLFNIIQPTGWTVGLTRIEDVALGCAVSVVVGLLFWPRGATAELGRALSNAFASGSTYLAAAIERLTIPGNNFDIEPSRAEAQITFLRLDDAFRQFVWERGAKVVPIATVSELFTGAVRIRQAAFQLATLDALPEEEGAAIESVDIAGAALRDASNATRDWYRQFGEALRGGDRNLAPTPEHHQALDAVLIGAFYDARASRRVDLVRSVLRMLWAREVLDDERVLQGQLAASAELFVRHGHTTPLI